jgi:hypothetical protein
LDIICSAIALKGNLDQTDEQEEEGVSPAAVHHPNLPYTNQDLVNICRLVDREREFKVDILYAGKRNSYKIRAGKKLKSYLRYGKQDLPQSPMMMTVFRSWLKKYLDWFNPDMLQ